MDLPIELPITKVEKEKAADLAFTEVEKKYGKGSIFSLAKNMSIVMPHIPTGIFSLDHNVIGIGGVPKGRVLEFFGPESSGKTTLALKIIASAQCAGGLCAYVDAENALDPVWAGKNGVDTKSLMVSQPETGEEGLDIVSMLVDSGAFAIIVVDSVAALVPRAELEGEIGDANVGMQSRLMSQALRMLSSKVRRSQSVVIFINQIREKIGVTFGNPETTPGGRALKFYSSLRLDIRRIATLKEGEVAFGNRVKIKAVKNKVGTPYRLCEIDLLFDSGFSSTGDLLDNSVNCGIIDKSGAWFSFKGERLGQGRAKAIDALVVNKGWLSEIYKSLLERIESK